jgi:hypothetical protein
MRHRRATSEGAEVVSHERFRVRVDALIDLSYRLSKLSRATAWAEIESEVTGVSPPVQRVWPRCRSV